MSKDLEHKAYSRRHVILYDEDWEFLISRFGRASSFRAGAAVAVRNIIHSHLNAVRAKVDATSPITPAGTDDLTNVLDA